METIEAVNAVVAKLERRVAVLEAKEQVQRRMYRWARYLDEVERTADPEVCRRMLDDMAAPGLCFKMSTVGFGDWGPDPEDIVERFTSFSEGVEYAYHYYHHGEIDVDLDAGTAHFYTGHECVPLKLGGEGKWLFLVQNSDWKLIDGKWRIVCYELTEGHLVKADGSDW